MELTLRGEDAAHWVYRGEGAVNLVLAYTGSSPSFVSSYLHLTTTMLFSIRIGYMDQYRCILS